MRVSIKVFLTSVRPPTSFQPSSPAWCSGTFLMDAGVNPSMASLKSSWVRIISGWGLSADCSGFLSVIIITISITSSHYHPPPFSLCSWETEWKIHCLFTCSFLSLCLLNYTNLKNTCQFHQQKEIL